MLVLSRQRDEVIKIGDDIEITVVDIRGDKVRLGINAPSRVAVHRKEVYEAITRENAQAAGAAHDLASLPGGAGRPVRGTGVLGAGGLGAGGLGARSKAASRLAVPAARADGTRVASGGWSARSA